MRVLIGIISAIVIIWAIMYVGAFIIGISYRVFVTVGIPVLIIGGLYKLFKK